MLSAEETGLWVQGAGKRLAAKSKVDQGDKAEAAFLYKEAIKDYTNAMHLKPQKASTHNNRGWTKYLFGQLKTEARITAEAQKLYQEAISDVNEALRLKPKVRDIGLLSFTRAALQKLLSATTTVRLKISVNPFN